MAARPVWCHTEVSCSFERFRNSFGNGPQNADKEIDVAYSTEKTLKEI